MKEYKSHFQAILAARHQLLTRVGGHWGVLGNRWSGWGVVAGV